MSLFRSFLFAPGSHARRTEKALALDADAVILDLEDAVAIAEKKATRPVVVAALQRSARSRACKGYVRVNAMSTEFCRADIDAVVQRDVDGIVLPKLETADEIRAIDWMIGQLEHERGLPRGTCDIIPIIETGRGLSNVGAIAAAGTRVRRLSFGAGDFTLDMNLAWSRSEAELASYRAAVVLASRAANLEPPIDSVWVDLADTEGLRASTLAAKHMGFQGKLCIHPDQVPVVNAVFSPMAEEVQWSRRVIAAFKAAEEAGSASIQLDGKFIDYPIVYRAERIVAAAERIKERGKRG